MAIPPQIRATWMLFGSSPMKIRMVLPSVRAVTARVPCKTAKRLAIRPSKTAKVATQLRCHALATLKKLVSPMRPSPRIIATERQL